MSRCDAGTSPARSSATGISEDVLREMVSAFKPSDSYALWTLFMLERWHQLIMDESSWQPGQEQQLERMLQ